MKNVPLKINLKSLLSLITIFILMFGVMAPVALGTSVGSEQSEVEKKYESENPIEGEIIDFSDFKRFKFFEQSKVFNAGQEKEEEEKKSGCKITGNTVIVDGKEVEEITYASFSVGKEGIDSGYSITKRDNDYTIKLRNLTAKKIILPPDVADGSNGANFLKKSKGVIAARKTHITIELEGTNKITGYGLTGYYVKGLTIKGNGSLNITTHIEKIEDNNNGNGLIVPGIFIETDDIKQNDANSGFIVESKVTVTNPYYWGIICNGEMQVKNNASVTVNSYEGIKRLAQSADISADRLFKETGATVKADRIYIYKTSVDSQGTYYNGDNVSDNSANKKTPASNTKKAAQQVASNPPAIEGAKAGEVYCEDPVITVTDNKQITSIEVNGIGITKFVYNSWTKKTFSIPTYIADEKEIVATDSDGNKTTLKFISYDEHPANEGTVKNTVAATCTTNGSHEIEYKCRICNKVIETKKVTDKALGHSYGNWSTISVNQDERTCTRCGHTETLDTSVKIADTQVLLSATKYVYDGRRKEPTVTIKDGDETLVEGEDYTAQYSNNVKAGKATVTITGKDHYTGTITENFEIKKESNSITASNITTDCSTRAQNVKINARQEGDANLTYSSNNKSVTVDSLGKVTIAKNFAGKATITITANETENYNKATKQITVTVNKANNKITASNFTKKYSSKAQSFTIGAKQVGNAKLTYSSNNKNVTVSSSGKVTIAKGFIGKATITITANATTGYNKATKQITITVNPPAITISKLSNTASKKLTVTWKKDTAVTGYQIQYSTDKNFKKGVKTVTVKKNGTTSTTISKLTKNKTYYVRVRSYKTVSKVNYYSSWNVKSIKIKK